MALPSFEIMDSQFYPSDTEYQVLLVRSKIS